MACAKRLSFVLIRLARPKILDGPKHDFLSRNGTNGHEQPRSVPSGSTRSNRVKILRMRGKGSALLSHSIAHTPQSCRIMIIIALLLPGVVSTLHSQRRENATGSSRTWLRTYKKIALISYLSRISSRCDVKARFWEGGVFCRNKSNIIDCRCRYYFVIMVFAKFQLWLGLAYFYSPGPQKCR